MDAAIRLIGWFEREGDRVTSILEGSVLKQEEDLIVRMLTGKKEGMTARDIHKNNKGRFPKVEEAKEALDELIKKGQVKAVQYQDPKGGRPTTRYVLAG
jgi:predicted ArsR family transcriptional regulator